MNNFDDFNFDDLNIDLTDIDFDLNNIDLSANSVPDSTKYKKKEKIIPDELNRAKIFLEKADIRSDYIKNKTYLLISNVLTDLRLPAKGEQLRIRTQQQFNMISLVIKIFEKYEVIDELTIASYTLNKEAYHVLIDLLKTKKIAKLNLLLASSYSYREKDYFESLQRNALELSKIYDYHLTFAWSHFKITLIRCNDDFYQIEGSMNYSMNNMAEQTIFENDRKTYEYDYNFITNIMRQKENKALKVVC